MSAVQGEVVQVDRLTKVFGHRRQVKAVDDLSFTVHPGRVTGFLGPNGSGKTTTLRCLLGLVQPSAGRALVGDREYRDLADPTRRVGAALEASGFHPGRSARNHLRTLAAATGIPDSRVDEVLGTVGLQDAARRRVVEYSLGMRQRLALAAALLGDPGVLILDEPANGLDPEGIAWLRSFLRERAAAGCTVLVSSHVLSEVQQTVDDVVIIRSGALVHAGPLSDIGGAGSARTLVRSPEMQRLLDGIRADFPDAVVDVDSTGAAILTGVTAQQVGHVAFTSGCELHELSSTTQDLEQMFLELTGGAS